VLGYLPVKKLPLLGAHTGHWQKAFWKEIPVSTIYEPVDIRGANVGIAESSDRIETQLVRADPQDVGGFFHHEAMVSSGL